MSASAWAGDFFIFFFARSSNIRAALLYKAVGKLSSSFRICRLKSLHDSGVGMCSVGSSDVSILHPPSLSPVPGPGIPLPAMAGESLFHPLFLSINHKHTQNHSRFQPSISFLPYFATFSVSSTCLCVIPLSTAVFSFQLTLSATLSFWFICMVEDIKKRDADSASRARTAPLCPSRPRLRFVMLDNTRQRGDKISAAANKKSLVFFTLSLSNCWLHFLREHAEFSRPFLWARETHTHTHKSGENKFTGASYMEYGLYKAVI